MSHLNRHHIIGNLGADPDIRYTQSNVAVATLSVATTEKWKDSNGETRERTEWHRCIAWHNLAEICQKYLKKGSKVYLDGPLQTRSWEDKDGTRRYTTEMKVRNMIMLDSAGSSTRPPHPGEDQQEEAPANDPDPDDDSLPF